MMNNPILIGSRLIGHGQQTYIIAEMSGNHNMVFNRAVKIVEVAKECGADRF